MAFSRSWSEKTRGLGDTAQGYVDISSPHHDVMLGGDEAMIYDDHVIVPRHADKIINVAQAIDLAGSAAYTTVCAFRCPQAFQAMIRFIANSVGSSGDLASVTWTLRINDTPISGFANFLGLLSPGLQSPFPVRIDLRPNDRIVILAKNSSTATLQDVAARLYGWAWAMNSPPMGG